MEREALSAAFLGTCLVLCIAAAKIAKCLMRKYAPDVILFGGAFTVRSQYEHIEHIIRKRCPFATIRVHCAPEELREDWWARYTPLESEIQYQRNLGWDEEKATYLAECYTYCADEKYVPAVVEKTLGVKSWWRQTIVVGFSNGCIPAFELASRMPPGACLWLASGVPSARQQQLHIPKHLAQCIVTAGDRENMWGGAWGVFIASPDAVHIRFHGSHCREPDDVCDSVFRIMTGQ